MDKANIYSRAYKKVLWAECKAGTPIQIAKELAREKGKQATFEFSKFRANSGQRDTAAASERPVAEEEPIAEEEPDLDAEVADAEQEPDAEVADSEEETEAEDAEGAFDTENVKKVMCCAHGKQFIGLMKEALKEIRKIDTRLKAIEQTLRMQSLTPSAPPPW